MEFQKIVALVKEASKVVYNEDLKKNITVKNKADFVTEVDLQINKFLKENLKSIDSSIGFFSEEERGSLNDPCWILDPIDGTTNLIFGYQMSSISLALYRSGIIEFGVVYNPYSKELYTAEMGKGSYLGKKRLHVSSRLISESIVEFGAGSTHKENADQNFIVAKTIFMQCLDIRRICSSALSLCFIADSRIDGYFEKVLKPWDIAAGSLILSEAGGKITNYEGSHILFDKPTSVIASNEVIHDFLANAISQR